MLVAVSAALVWVGAGCQSSPPAGECVSDDDCIHGFACIDGACQTESVQPGPSRLLPDAGTLRRDAGYRDAGTPVDATYTIDAGLVDSGLVDAGQCGPAACVDLNATCGWVIDPCGTQVDCGSCAMGMVCGAVGTPDANRCVPEPCVPRCPSYARCGWADDGCGGQIDCGGCGSDHSCSSNQCVRNVCHPRTCSDRGAECGTIDDGCGGRPNCGSCSGTQTCGNDNQCHCTDQESWTIFHRFKSVRSIGATVSADWSQLNDALQINSQGANVRLTSSQPRSDILYLYDPQLNLPSDATVLGIEVELRLKRNGTDPFLDYLYVWQSNLSGTTKRGLRLSGISTNYRTYTYGGESDLWGIPPSDLLTLSRQRNHVWHPNGV